LDTGFFSRNSIYSIGYFSPKVEASICASRLLRNQQGS
jgi:hypothetical protein